MNESKADDRLLVDLETLARSSDTGERWMGAIAVAASAEIKRLRAALRSSAPQGDGRALEPNEITARLQKVVSYQYIGEFARNAIWDAIAALTRPQPGCAVAGPTERADGKFEGALERIALLDEADGHELTREHALRAVAIASSTLGKHPSEILARTDQYDPAFVEELKRADVAPPEAEFSNVEEMLEHLNGGAVAGTERGAISKVCGYHDGCPPDGPVCHLCEHLQPSQGK